MSLSIYAQGRPAPQGSKIKGKRGNVYEASKYLPAWREVVVEETKRSVRNNREWDCTEPAVGVVVTFQLERPQNHYIDRTRTMLRSNVPLYVTNTPDIDKLSRAVLDALKLGGAIVDDARVVQLITSKMYATLPAEPGAFIVVTAINATLMSSGLTVVPPTPPDPWKQP